MWLHLSPITNALCIVLKRNCWTLVLSTGFLRAVQIVASVPSEPVIDLIASLAISRFLLASGRVGDGLRARMPL